MLNPYDIMNGTFSLIFIIISVAVGIRITLSYKKQKDSLYLIVGICWILMTESWYPSAISFLIALFTGGDGLLNHPEIYFIIGNVLVPLNQSLWLLAITNIFYKEKQKIVLISYVIFGIIFEIIFFYLIIFNSSAIGVLESPVDVDYHEFLTIWIIINLIIWIVPGIIFARASIKSDNPEHKLKGWLLILAFLLFGIGGILDSITFNYWWILPITRMILITSAICYLGGFVLPDWMKKLFLRKK